MSTVNVPLDKLRNVASYQRAMLILLGASVVVAVFTLLRVGGVIEIPPEWNPIAIMPGKLVTVLTIGTVYLLARQFTNTVVALVLGLSTIVPFLPLAVLLGVNQWACRYLHRHGVKVGFFGASPGSI